MDELRLLKAKYENGKISQEEYLRQLDKLLEDEVISQEEYDEAKDYNPENDEPLIYSQSDVNRVVKGRAMRELRKYLRDAGADPDEFEDLEEGIKELIKKGLNADEATPDEKEIQDLKKKADKYDQLIKRYSLLEVENEVLKTASKFNPVDPKQVVRAITTDYKELLEYEEGQLVKTSVEKAVERVAKAEPNLFNYADNDDEGDGDDRGGFKGKGPRKGGSDSGNKKDAEYEKKKREALRRMGINVDD